MDKEALYESAAGSSGPAALLLEQSEGCVGHTKTASASLLPEVQRFIDGLHAEEGARYVLINGMGASEYYGCNANKDAWPEAGLVCLPSDWGQDVAHDKQRAKTIPYGLGTFYNAHLFSHHQNKNPNKKIGDIEFVVWNDRMKRVELVVKVLESLCKAHGGQEFWSDLLVEGYPCVSMGARVPWDRCSVSTDMRRFYEALATYDPKRHTDPGKAVLEVHERLLKETGKGLPGIARNRKEYGEAMLRHPGAVDPRTGRMIFVFNDFPRFFDMSMVKRGADSTAKAMRHIHRMTKTASSYLPPDIGGQILDNGVKLAHPLDLSLLEKEGVDKAARLQKKSEIDKRIDAEFSRKIPEVGKGESPLPKEVLHAMAEHSPGEALSTAGALGIVLRPQEFQRMMLVRIGVPQLADQLEDRGVCFSYETPRPMPLDGFSPLLGHLLESFLGQRSGHAPYLRIRVGVAREPALKKMAASLPDPLLSKLGGLYQGYRQALMQKLSSSQANMAQVPSSELRKLATQDPTDLFTSLSYAYFSLVFQDEVAPTRIP